MKRKVCFVLRPAAGGAGGLLLKGQLPPWTTRDQSFSRQREGLHAEMAQSAGRAPRRSLDTPWADWCHLNGFKSSLSSVPGSVRPHFFEASSQNGGS